MDRLAGPGSSDGTMSSVRKRVRLTIVSARPIVSAKTTMLATIRMALLPAVPTDGAYEGVVRIPGGNEFRTPELCEYGRIVDGENCCGELVLESSAVDIIDVATHRPLIVGKGWCFPDHSDLRRIDFARLPVELPYRVIEDADLERARLHELDGPAVVAREA